MPEPQLDLVGGHQEQRLEVLHTALDCPPDVRAPCTCLQGLGGAGPALADWALLFS